MSEAVIVAIIAGGMSLIGTIVTVLATNKGTEMRLFNQLDKHQAVTDTKIDNLAEKVAKHNNLIERTYGLEQRMAVAEERISDANHRINELRDDNK